MVMSQTTRDSQLLESNKSCFQS